MAGEKLATNLVGDVVTFVKDDGSGTRVIAVVRAVYLAAEDTVWLILQPVSEVGPMFHRLAAGCTVVTR